MSLPIRPSYKYTIIHDGGHDEQETVSADSKCAHTTRMPMMDYEWAAHAPGYVPSTKAAGLSVEITSMPLCWPKYFGLDGIDGLGGTPTHPVSLDDCMVSKINVRPTATSFAVVVPVAVTSPSR